MNDYYTSCNMHKTYSLLLVVNQVSKIKCQWNGSGIRGLAGTVVNWRALRKWGCRCSTPTRYSCARLLWPDLQNVQEELEIQMFICNYQIVKRQQCVHIFFFLIQATILWAQQKIPVGILLQLFCLGGQFQLFHITFLLIFICFGVFAIGTGCTLDFLQYFLVKPHLHVLVFNCNTV